MNSSPVLAAILVAIATIPTARADEVKAAVAANFTEVAQKLAPLFAARSGHRLVTSFGSSGKLVSQIENGAPFEVFLSADSERPKALEARGEATGRFTYAVGRLVLWSSRPDDLGDGAAFLRQGSYNRVAVANPRTAPYGSAAEQALDRLGLLEAVRPKLVTGDSIAQTFQFAVSGNADLAFVALAQVRALPPDRAGSSWVVPQSLYDPIEQDAVLLKRGADSAAARAFMQFLRSEEARETIRSYGYETR